MKGYINLYRSIQSHWTWRDPRKLKAWLYLLLNAEWEPRDKPWDNEIIHLERGQVLTSIRELMAKWGTCTETTLEYLRLFSDMGMIVRSPIKKFTLLTIVNFDEYQSAANIVERKPKRKIERPKEEVRIEEEKKLNIISPSRESDLNFFEDFIKDEVYLEQVAMTIHVDLAALRELAAQFKLEMLTKEKFHPSLQEYKQHFFNWAKLNIQKGGGTKKFNLNEDKHNARRSAPVAVRDFDSDDETF